jgi:hypothetical protein
VRRLLLAVSWLVTIQAILISLFAIALLSGSWVEPGYPTFIRIAVIVLGGFLPIVLSLIALHDPRTAARFGLPLAVLTFIPLFATVGGSYSVLMGGFGFWEVPLALSLFILVIPAIFWKILASLAWPLSLNRSLRSSLAHHRFSCALTLLGVLLMVAISSLSVTPWNAPIGDCGGRSLLDERGVPRGVDFTAKIIFVGPKTPYGILRGRSLWSVARVQERFGQRFDIPRYVILRGVFAAADTFREYFVESTVGSNTILGDLFPVVEPLECGRTALLQDAGAWIRVLRQGAPKGGSWLIGRVYIGVSYDHHGRKPAPGTYVSLEGANGTIVSVADADGVYDFTGLPSGTYTLRATVTTSDGRAFSDVQPFRLKEAEVRDWDLYAR